MATLVAATSRLCGAGVTALRRIRHGPRHARIAKAAEACALAGSVAEGVSISMDTEQRIYEAGRLQDAASLLNRLSRE
jgi:hypothetical protein